MTTPSPWEQEAEAQTGEKTWPRSPDVQPSLLCTTQGHVLIRTGALLSDGTDGTLGPPGANTGAQALPHPKRLRPSGQESRAPGSWG